MPPYSSGNDLNNPAVTLTPEEQQKKIAEMQAAAVPSVPPAPGAYPNDPATLSGVRNNPLYLGPTNFATIQKQYTPYQIEQATTRNATGDIFWKEGVNISDIPREPAKTTFTAPATVPTPTSTDLNAGGASATPPLTRADMTTDFTRAQGEAAKTYLTGIQASIDSLFAKQQEMASADKAQAETALTGLKGKLSSFLGGTQYQDALAKDRELFQVKQTIDNLNMVKQKLADAVTGLDQGLIYEESRPVRMQLLQGRMSELKKQGLAQIGALQATAEVFKGNLDLARAYAQDTFAAIQQDNKEKMAAIGVLIDLEQSNLIRLDKNEKDVIQQRMDLLKDESKRVNDEKDQLVELAIKYPDSFMKGGATFNDTVQSALAKMNPYLSQIQQLELQKSQLDIEQQKIDILKTKAEITKLGKTGSGSGSGSDGSSNLIQDIAASISYLRGQGYNETEIRAAIFQEYGGKLKTTELNGVVDNVLQGTKTVSVVDQQKERLSAAQQLSEAKGLLTLDVEQGKYVASDNKAVIQRAADKGFISWDGSAWKTKDGTVVDPSKVRDPWYRSPYIAN